MFYKKGKVEFNAKFLTLNIQPLCRINLNIALKLTLSALGICYDQFLLANLPSSIHKNNKVDMVCLSPVGYGISHRRQTYHIDLVDLTHIQRTRPRRKTVFFKTSLRVFIHKNV